MRERIGIEQLKELSKEQKQRLREWWQPQDPDVYVEEYGNGKTVTRLIGTGGLRYPEIDLPLLSIGQMFSLLGTKIQSILHHENGQWIVFCHHIPYSKAELVDALWDAVIYELSR